MAKSPSNLAVRLATAAVGAPAIIVLLYRGPAWGFYLLAIASTVIGAWELFSMTHPRDRASKIIGVFGAAAVSLALYCFGQDVRVVLSLVVLAAAFGPLVTLLRLGEIESAALRASAMSFGVLYIGVPLTLLPLMRRDLGGDGPSFVLLSFGFAWLGDTGGYFAGRFLGKRKLYEAVSPKKTVEGAMGGLVATALWAVLAHFWFLKSLPLVSGIVLAVIAGCFGQLGDLGESVLKRSTGVKDSGQLIPGHGGILDRVDALLLTGSVVYLYTLWFHPIR